jgi:Gpi18-like mannosyltransferase
MSIRDGAGRLLARDEVQIIGASLILKLLVIAFGVFVVMVLGDRVAPEPDGMSGAAPAILAPWVRWDAPHYLDLAVFGYRAVDAGALVGPGGYRSLTPGDLPHYIVFFPLFPLLVGAATQLVRDPSIAAFAVSGIALAFVGPLMYRLVAIDEGRIVAKRSVWFLLIFPTAYFLYIGYSESLFLALALGSFLAARSDRWWLAGVLGALATLARLNGLVLVAALAVEAYLQWREGRVFRWRWVAIGLVPLGFVGYLGLNLAVYGDAGAFVEIQHTYWNKSLSPPWIGIGNLLASELPRAWIPELAFIGLGVVGTIVAAVRFRPSWTIWMAGNLLLFTSTSFVLSVPRYTLVLFPLFVWFALLSSSRVIGVLIGGASVAGLIFFASRFALGLWAF